MENEIDRINKEVGKPRKVTTDEDGKLYWGNHESGGLPPPIVWFDKLSRLFYNIYRTIWLKKSYNNKDPGFSSSATAIVLTEFLKEERKIRVLKSDWLTLTDKALINVSPTRTNIVSQS
jgi:hypothetical protein